MQHGVHRQPSALYELILDLVLFAAIWHLRDRMPRLGDLFRLYVVSFSSIRFLVDFTRADPHVFLGLTLVQVLYTFAIVGFSYSLWRSFHEGRLLKAVRTMPEQHVLEMVS